MCSTRIKRDYTDLLLFVPNSMVPLGSRNIIKFNFIKNLLHLFENETQYLIKFIPSLLGHASVGQSLCNLLVKSDTMKAKTLQQIFQLKGNNNYSLCHGMTLATAELSRRNQNPEKHREL
ncbi:unnamed protein product [Lupinus luteus]|uniref:Uncharacterized protein n=1 Tax=Lupinus luteus TaxID=3873 RepID=A0AAV1XUI7_LUPLU